MPDLAPLLDIFRRARALIERPDNDFGWSSWDGVEAARAEIDALIARLEHGELPAGRGMEVIFAPTGPMQELSLSSGWGQAFCDLADEFDAAVAAAGP